MPEDGDGNTISIDRCKSNEKKINRLEHAMFGPDGTAGIVKKVDRIEYQTGLIRFVGQGIFGIAVSLITLIVVRVLGL